MHFSEQSPEVLQYENYDLQNIKTPVNVEALETLLKQSNYDPAETSFLIYGFKNGFSIGYEGPQDVKLTSPNLKFRQVGKSGTNKGKR